MTHTLTVQVVFRAGRGREARLYRDQKESLPGATVWTHVGILFGQVVCHASPGRLNETPDDQGRYPGSGVIVEPLASFIHTDIAQNGAFLDAADLAEDQSQQIISWCMNHAQRHTPFDGTYDLKNERALYCTELVWKAFATAGVTLCSPPFTVKKIPFIGGREIILPGHLANSGRLSCSIK